MFIGEPSRACFKCSALQMYVFCFELAKEKAETFWSFRLLSSL